MSTSIVCSDLSFTWPAGRTVFDGLDLVISTGRTGLIGANGSGKSTLLRLAAGELKPTRVRYDQLGDEGGIAGLSPAAHHPAGGAAVEQVLGVAEVRAALAAIEVGDTSPQHFTAVGE